MYYIMSCYFLISHLIICFIICQAFADLVIKVLDENDSPPKFKENSYEAAIAENSMAGEIVVPVSSKFWFGRSVNYYIKKKKQYVEYIMKTGYSKRDACIISLRYFLI